MRASVYSSWETEQERRTVDLLLKGLKNKEIAEIEGIKLKSVKFRVTYILRKYKVPTRTHLIILLTKDPSKRMPVGPAHRISKQAHADLVSALSSTPAMLV